MKIRKTILAYHFVGRKLRDGRPIPPDGQWLMHRGRCVLCENGLHASRDPFDALRHAPGNTLCLVECSGEIVEGESKLVCTRRKIVKRINAEKLLRRFAREQALSVTHLWKVPSSLTEYLKSSVKRKQAAAWVAAWVATRKAAQVAAQDAAQEAAQKVTEEVARETARETAWRAARKSAWKAARKRFNELVKEAFELERIGA